MSKNQSLLSLMPPEAQKQVLLLIKRLGDEKQAKQQAQKQCLMYEAEIVELKKELEKLKKENITLKAKWQNSFSMISKVRENFSGSKKSSEDHEDIGKKKLRFNKEQGNWEEESEQEQESNIGSNGKRDMNNGQISSNQALKTQNSRNTTFAIGSPHHSVPFTNIQTSRSQQNNQPSQLLPPSTTKKPPRNPLSNQQSHQKPPNPFSLSKSRQLNTTRSNKKLQIECLKQEIQQLTQEIKVKETGSMSLSDKIRKCEEIKNRYKKGGLNGSGSQEELRGQLNNSSIGMMNSYQSPIKQPPNNQSFNNQQSFINELSSNQKPSNFTQRYPNPTQRTPQNQHYLKQNIRMNPQLDQSQYINNNSSFIQNSSSSFVHQASGYYGGSNNSNLNNQLASSNVMKKTGNKNVQQQQSFYDEGLLDLINDLNP